jgi:hypothetical protein
MQRKKSLMELPEKIAFCARKVLRDESPILRIGARFARARLYVAVRSAETMTPDEIVAALAHHGTKIGVDEGRHRCG